MKGSLLIECIFVYLALLPNISAIFSLAFLATCMKNTFSSEVILTNRYVVNAVPAILLH